MSFQIFLSALFSSTSLSTKYKRKTLHQQEIHEFPHTQNSVYDNPSQFSHIHGVYPSNAVHKNTPENAIGNRVTSHKFYGNIKGRGFE